jgi:transposase
MFFSSMPRTTKTHELTPATRGRIYQGYLDGLPIANLARVFDCTRHTVYSTVKRFEDSGDGKDRPRPGRPRKVNTIRMERRVLADIERNKWDSWTKVAEDIGETSSTSVQRVAHDNGIHRCVAILKPVISPVNIGKRLAYATKNTGRRWDNVIFTDETSLELGKHSGKRHISRHANEDLDPEHITPNFASGRRSIMLWGAISYHGKSRLVELHWPETVVGRNGKPKKGGFTNKEYADQILSKALREFYEGQFTITGSHFEVVEDGAPVHKGPFVRAARE